MVATTCLLGQLLVRQPKPCYDSRSKEDELGVLKSSLGILGPGNAKRRCDTQASPGDPKPKSLLIG
jgi:hypothetical protein